MAITPAQQQRNTQIQTIKSALQNAKGSISAVAAKHLTPDRLLKVALAACQRSPGLLKCSPVSLVQVVVGCAELGLEPNALGHAYLVPYGEVATLIVGYRGLLELAYRSGRILDVTSECVFEGDEFEYKLGTDPFINHVPQGETDSEKCTHAYTIVRFKDGGQVMRVMTRKQLDAIRQRSKASKNGPWVTDTVEMYRKTVLRNTLKYCPMSIEMAKAEAADIQADTGESALGDFDWIDAEPVDEPAHKNGTQQLKDKIKNRELHTWESCVFSPDIDMTLSALGMAEKEAADWSSAGVSLEDAARIVAENPTLAHVQNAFQEASS